eukprot:m.64232 g.64232  ORF g.64232 m.64232 type:complete len:55 (+) comp11992_c1_seq1:1826-1990(+)
MDEGNRRSHESKGLGRIMFENTNIAQIATDCSVASVKHRFEVHGLGVAMPKEHK